MHKIPVVSNEGMVQVREDPIMSHDATAYAHEGPIMSHEGTTSIRKASLCRTKA